MLGMCKAGGTKDEVDSRPQKSMYVIVRTSNFFL